jgi:hypothetical protein
MYLERAYHALCLALWADGAPPPAGIPAPVGDRHGDMPPHCELSDIHAH